MCDSPSCTNRGLLSEEGTCLCPPEIFWLILSNSIPLVDIEGVCVLGVWMCDFPCTNRGLLSKEGTFMCP